MALFGKNKKEENTEVAPHASESVSAETQKVSVANVARAILKPRITEKAALLIDQNVYTFEVRMDANKYEVRDAIKALYNVTPTRVHLVKKTPRHFMSRMRGRDTMEHGSKKAYVYLKKGDRIDLV